MSMDKFCGRCKLNKSQDTYSISEYAKNSGWCRACMTAYYEENKEQTKTKKKERYEKEKENNICPICKKVKSKEDETTVCNACKKAQRDESQTRRDDAKNTGMCSKCWKNTARVGHKMCDDCIERPKLRLPLEQRLLNSARSRAKERGLEFTITINDITIPTHCPIFGYQLSMNEGHHRYNSYSLDRIDNSKGYIKGNVHVISMRANQLKGNATAEELELLASYFSKIA